MKQTLAVLCLVVITGVSAQQPDEAEKRTRFVNFVSRLDPVVDIRSEVDAGRAPEIYKNWAATASADTAIPVAKMAEIYTAAGEGAKAFKTIAHLIKTKAISNEHSIAMAEVREAEIQGLIKQIGTENDWKIARSDSGNTSSGMKSDLDQTFYVFEPDLDENDQPRFQEDGTKKYKRSPDLDQTFIAEFERRWDAKHQGTGLSRAALDIASIEGKNRFPDPRQVVGTGFWSENRRAAEALRHTPGAYTYAGAVG
ncbi:MAG: hypothetical protein KDB18_12905, partial [Salinibacterium sp.]|nr:hypothetical protein [Salinibacterium sp.]